MDINSAYAVYKAEFPDCSEWFELYGGGATLDGSFTADELRLIARLIEEIQKG